MKTFTVTFASGSILTFRFRDVTTGYVYVANLGKKDRISKVVVS